MTTVDDRRPAPHPAIETAFLQDEAVLYDARTGHVHELSPSASAVWLLLDGVATVDAVVDELHELLGVDREILQADVPTVISDFAERGLLDGTELVEAPDANGHHHAPAGRSAAGATLRVLARPPDP